MGDGGAAVVVHDVAVVDGAEVLVGIGLLGDAEEAVEVLSGLGLHEVVLVGEGPPDVAKGSEASDDVAEVAIVGFGGHGGVAPAVVGMEEDDVGFDIKVAEAGEEVLEVGEECGVETGGVVDALRVLFAGGGGAGEGVELWLVVVELVGLGEDAHSDLVEGRGGKGGEGLLLHLAALMSPGVAGGSEGEVGRAVGVGEVVDVADGDGAVAVGGSAEEGAGVVGEGGGVAAGGEAPGAFGVGHEADFVGAVAVVESVHLD